MAAFYLTPQMRERRRKLRLRLALLNLKKKMLGALSESDEATRREIMQELARHY